MRIIKLEDRDPMLIKQLVELWKDSVKNTHLFLLPTEINNIQSYVLPALANISHLIIIENKDFFPIAFMGIEGQKIEMLFIASKERRHGLGKKLVKFGIEKYSINELSVNEQNPQAKAFYENMGFHVYKRTERDEQGMPYPILYMRLP